MSGFPDPEVVHHYSHQTKVSLELPFGWVLEREEEYLAVYVATLGPGDHVPRLTIKVIETPGLVPGLQHALAQSMLELPRQEMKHISHKELEIDGFPGVADLFSFTVNSTGLRLSQYQVFIQVDQVLYSFSGAVEEPFQDTVVPVFDRAVGSARFIPL